ncbi:MAG: DUF547 domain-containing protein [Planctomycetes bacterium]|nr:DUF547 domain-containing protein [Planctomycetota bacterium]
MNTICYRRAILIGWILLGSAGAVGRAAARDVPAERGDGFATEWDRLDLSETHALWTQVLSDHVDEAGLVDYAAIGRDRRYREYLYRLAHTDPGGLPNDDAKRAFWINAYNAVAIRGVLETLPVDTAKWPTYSVEAVQVEGESFFRGLRFLVGGVRLSLDELEKALLLRDPAWFDKDPERYGRLAPRRPDPRVHFALVCCAKGCPPLRRWAFRGPALEEQLTEVTRSFASDGGRCRFDLDGRRLAVSMLLQWYGRDFVDQRFAPRAPSVVQFLARYVSDPTLAASLERDSWRLEYLLYDWALNLQP